MSATADEETLESAASNQEENIASNDGTLRQDDTPTIFKAAVDDAKDKVSDNDIAAAQSISDDIVANIDQPKTDHCDETNQVKENIDKTKAEDSKNPTISPPVSSDANNEIKKDHCDDGHSNVTTNKDDIKEARVANKVITTQSESDVNVLDVDQLKKDHCCGKSPEDFAENVTYTDDGNTIYTDPQTKYKYKWNADEEKWQAFDDDDAISSTSTTNNPYENEHYRWCNETQQWIPKIQTTETEHYKWDAEKNEWIPKDPSILSVQEKPNEPTYGLDEDGQRTYTDKDGMVYIWDVDKSAWFPKIDDDFMARYQMNYGFIDNTTPTINEKEEALKKEKELAERKAEELQRITEEIRAETTAAALGLGAKRKGGAQEPAKWFDLDPEQNTKVYVSNLPLDITIDEFAELMGKCGMIMRDPQTQKYKLKLYTEADGQIKGDGLCDYIKVESVDLALKILDEYNLRGHKIRVQRAKFQMRGEYNPALKPKRKKKDKEKLQKMKEKLFDWRPDKMRGERSKNEKVVIIKNLFEPKIFEEEVELILEFQNDLREECSKCGTVRKVVIFDRHPEGVAQINMASPEEADVVIQMMQGRYFGKRQLTAEHWDGKTKYKIDESETEANKRLTNWDQFLETDDKKDKTAMPVD